MLRTIDDLDDDEITWALERATALSAGAPLSVVSGPRILGLVFLEPSLRTRFGFATAAARLGWRTVEVHEPRATGGSHAESAEDTLRVASGYCDLVVARPGRPLSGRSALESIACPYINGGDTGPEAQHPTQALIDLFAIERLRGHIEDLTVAIVGDVGMRAARSLISLLGRRPPRETIVVSHPAYLDTPNHLDGLSHAVIATDLAAARNADIVYVAGLPHGSLSTGDRRSLVVTEQFVSSLSHDTVILSPMPVMDEVEIAARQNPRVRFNEQSDLAAYVRIACLELVTARQ